MAPIRSSSFSKSALVVFSLLLIVLLQYEYDATKMTLPSEASGSGVTPFMVRMADLGFSPAVASFLWTTTMPEILDLFNGHAEYLNDVAFVNAVDPNMSYPYAFSVLTLPAIPLKDFQGGLEDALAIGSQGLRSADPDWRIPYYMAMDYYLGLNDTKDALTYFDLAARTPGVPQFAERFSLNFGIGSNQRETTKELWITIRDSTNDEFTKARAQAYIDHLDDLDIIQAAAAQYKQAFGVYPTSTDELLARGILSAIPQDPFGFTFVINGDGTSGIDLNKLPSYILAQPAQ
jgi:hypothetical protein